MDWDEFSHGHCKPSPMRMWPIVTRVNKPENDDRVATTDCDQLVASVSGQAIGLLRRRGLLRSARRIASNTSASASALGRRIRRWTYRIAARRLLAGHAPPRALMAGAAKGCPC
jgi:hypothetical protein